MASELRGALAMRGKHCALNGLKEASSARTTALAVCGPETSVGHSTSQPTPSPPQADGATFQITIGGYSTAFLGSNRSGEPCGPQSAPAVNPPPSSHFRDPDVDVASSSG